MPTGEVGRGRATFAEFLSRYKTDNMYCVSEVPSPMFPDLSLPGIMNCGELASSIVEVGSLLNLLFKLSPIPCPLFSIFAPVPKSR